MPISVTENEGQMRFALSLKHHQEAKIMRARTGLDNRELWMDMMRIYKKHPKEWASANRKV